MSDPRSRSSTLASGPPPPIPPKSQRRFDRGQRQEPTAGPSGTYQQGPQADEGHRGSPHQTALQPSYQDQFLEAKASILNALGYEASLSRLVEKVRIMRNGEVDKPRFRYISQSEELRQLQHARQSRILVINSNEDDEGDEGDETEITISVFSVLELSKDDITVMIKTFLGQLLSQAKEDSKIPKKMPSNFMLLVHLLTTHMRAHLKDIGPIACIVDCATVYDNRSQYRAINFRRFLDSLVLITQTNEGRYPLKLIITSWTELTPLETGAPELLKVPLEIESSDEEDDFSH